MQARYMAKRLWSDGEWGKTVIIFGVDNSSFMHGDNKKNMIR